MRQQLIILCGIPFSGKSVLAKKISKMLGYTRIDLDEVKFELFGQEIKDEQIKQDGWDTIYQKMYERIRQLLSQGKSVIHDTGNFTIYERGLISDIAQEKDINFVTVFVDTPIAIARERLEENRVSNKRFDITDQAFQEAVDEMEPPKAEENPLTYTYNQDISSWVKEHL